PLDGGGRVDRYLTLLVRLPFVGDDAVDEGEERVVLARTHVLSGVQGRADLAHEDVAGQHRGAGVDFHAAALRVRASAVAGGSCAFFVGHRLLLDLDTGDLELGIGLAVALLAAVILAAAKLEDDDFFSAILAQDFGADG